MAASSGSSSQCQSLSPRTARATDYVPCLTGNPHTAHQRQGTLYLHHPVDLVPVLYGEELDDASGDMGKLATLMGGMGLEEGGDLRGAPSEPTKPPETRSTYLAMLSVPSHMIPSDLLDFVSPFREDIRLMRVISHALPNRAPYTPLRYQAAKYIVLLDMKTQAAADAFYLRHSNHAFNSLEPTMCVLAYVRALCFQPSGHAIKAAGAGGGGGGPIGGPTVPSSLTGHTCTKPLDVLADIDRSHGDLPHCVVCLEPLRLPGVCEEEGEGGGAARTTTLGLRGSASHSQGGEGASTRGGGGEAVPVLITACNHAFHMECIRNLAGPLCPVCRYNHDSVSASVCSECRRTTDLWVCLICGHIGCGRYHSQHSRKHYLESLHAYAMEVQTQQVWDFAGDGYVHRLIYHKGEGGVSKLVEVTDPHTASDQRPHTAPLSDSAEEEIVHRKLESWALQYSLLLSSGLEEQRLLFERRLLELRAAQQHEKSTAAKLLAARRMERRQLEQRCVSARERLRKVREETGFLTEVNASLEANKGQLEEQIRCAEKDVAECEAQREAVIPVLEHRVQSLMRQLDGGGEAGARGQQELMEAEAASGGAGAEGGGGGGGVERGLSAGVEEAKTADGPGTQAAGVPGGATGEEEGEAGEEEEEEEGGSGRQSPLPALGSAPVTPRGAREGEEGEESPPLSPSLGRSISGGSMAAGGSSRKKKKKKGR